MRTRAKRKSAENRGDIPVSSFSDIAFLLIIFFLLATTLQQNMGVLADIPSGQKSSAPPEKTTIVNIYNGKLSLNDQAVDITKLRNQLKLMKLREKSDNAKVIMLEASGNVEYQLYFEVITAISEAGGALAIVEQDAEKE